VKRPVALLVFLAVVLGLLVVADRVAKGVAEDQLADRVAAEVSGSPSVSIGGFPFLTQALRGSYDRIEVTGGDLRQGGLQVSRFEVELHDVEVPLGDVLGGDVDTVPVSFMTATAVVTAEAVQAASGRPVQISTVGDQVQVTSQVTVLGRPVTVTGRSAVELAGQQLVVAPTAFTVAGAPAPSAVVAAVGDQLQIRVDVPELPYGLRVTGVHVGDGAVRVTAQAQDTTLSR
jgi:hypothetical protein